MAQRAFRLERPYVEFNDPGPVHRLCRVGAEVQEDLLQSSRLSQHTRFLGCFLNSHLDVGRERGTEHRHRLRGHGLNADALPPCVAAAAECEDLVDKVTGPLAREPDFIEAAGCPTVWFDTF